MTLIQEWVKKIYKVNSNPSLLPSTYQEVEYITSSTLWPRIDTWVIPNATTVSQIKLTPLTVTWAVIYWEAVSDSNDYRLFNYNSYIYFDLGWWRISGSVLGVGTTYELELGNFYVKYVWASSNILTGTTNPSYSWNNQQIYLNFDGSRTYSYSTWYYVKIRDNGVQVRNMIPCYRKSDDVVWMYDTINDVFYTNQGSWSFTAWPEVPEIIEKEVGKVYKGTIQIRPTPTRYTYEADFMQWSLPTWWSGSLGSSWLVSGYFTIDETDLSAKKVTLEMNHYESWSTWNACSQNIATGNNTSWNQMAPGIGRTIQGYPDSTYQGSWEYRYTPSSWNVIYLYTVGGAYYNYSSWVFYSKISFDFTTWEWSIYETSQADGEGDVVVNGSGTVTSSELATIKTTFTNNTIYWWFTKAWAWTSTVQRAALTIE